MHDAVYISHFMTEPHIVGPFVSDIEAGGRNPESRLRVKRGEPVSADELPNAIQAMGTDVDRKDERLTLPAIFKTGFFYVSAEGAAVLRRFDLGDTILKPIAIHRSDGVTPYPEAAFAFAFWNRARAFVPEASTGVSTIGKNNGLERWKSRGQPIDDAIALRASALPAVDLWFDDRMPIRFFLSGRLVAALRTAGLDEPFALGRCKVV